MKGNTSSSFGRLIIHLFGTSERFSMVLRTSVNSYSNPPLKITKVISQNTSEHSAF